MVTRNPGILTNKESSMDRHGIRRSMGLIRKTISFINNKEKVGKNNSKLSNKQSPLKSSLKRRHDSLIIIKNPKRKNQKNSRRHHRHCPRFIKSVQMKSIL